MREIKFRAWDTEAECYVKDPILVDNFGQVYVVCEESSGKQGTCLITHKPNVIKEQYTGLKDKNGKEIYEGDIIDFFGEKYPVIYRAGCFWAEYSRTQKDYLFLYAIDSEVIGNILENPELIGDGE